MIKSCLELLSNRVKARTHKMDRIAKKIARHGLCSRREAEKWIQQGRVIVDGVTLTSPAFNVSSESQIQVDGKLLDAQQPSRLWLYHKPAGLLTSHTDPAGRPTIFQSLSKTIPRVISVGRLDMNSEGLLLLTNDGVLARYLELPSTGLSRKYRVRVHGVVRESALGRLKKGVTLDGVRYGKIYAILDRRVGHNSWLSIELNEGKNREIRKVLLGIGLKVNRLIRTEYGPFSLGSLPPGEVRELRESITKSFNPPQ